ncbi:MAG: M23 family metallopeptidase [Rhizobiales bacterium]|nr:M23 family metallopeptidase [Hyphomicrobiales bacterium]
MSTPVFRNLPADLGLEPPLTADGAVAETMMRRRLSPRWMASLVLVALAGSVLMLFSVIAALSPIETIVTAPVTTRSADERNAGASSVTTARRSDKLIRKANLVAARQDYKAPILVRSGNAEITRHAGFTRLATPLATESLGFTDVIPAYNLARLVSLASEDRAATEGELSGTQETEIALALRDIATLRGRAESGIRLADDDARTQVIDMLVERRRDSPRLAAQSQLARVMRAPNEASAPSAFAAGVVADPFSKLVVRMVPENVTLLPRRDSVLTPFPIEERIILSRSVQATTQSLRGVGATPKQAQEIVAALTRNGRANNLDGGRVLKLTLQSQQERGPKELMRVDLFADEQLVASTGRRDDGSFWPIEARDMPNRPTETAEEDEEAEANSGRLTIYQAIHETARRYEIAPPIIDEIVRTVFFDVDLQRRVSPGDFLELLIANGEGEATPRQDLLLVSLSTGQTRRRYYRFKLTEEDVVDYFDEQGRSVKQFLLRKPIDGGEFRSGFGMRRHPITGSYRLHAGVDWAGPVGLAIRAAGNGVIRLAEWDSGYGRRVEIEHNHGYVTTYSHMSAFAPGIKDGVRVRQGQIIGRLGSSGLSTGPHLHYEVLINDRFVDPLAIRLPKGRELAGNTLNEFRRERDFIEGVIKRAPGHAAQLAQN